MDKGIIFSAPMVRALLDGRKTQTRRLLSLRGYRGFSEFGPSDTDGYDWHFRRADACWCDVRATRLLELLPYAPGDRLYVREAWSGLFWDPEDIDGPARELWATPRRERSADLCSGKFYRVDEEAKSFPCRFVPEGQWQPSIHMPRWASRLTLTVTDVLVQRVAEISEADAVAEGVERHPAAPAHLFKAYWPVDANPVATARESFRGLWNSLHTKPGETWDANPWIVAVRFSVAHGNIDRIPA